MYLVYWNLGAIVDIRDVGLQLLIRAPILHVNTYAQ